MMNDSACVCMHVCMRTSIGISAGRFHDGRSLQPECMNPAARLSSPSERVDFIRGAKDEFTFSLSTVTPIYNKIWVRAIEIFIQNLYN